MLAHVGRPGVKSALALGAVLAVILLADVSWAWPFDPGGHDWEGCADFVQLASEQLGARVLPTARIDYASLSPKDSVILLHPERPVDDASLASFMRAGGRVALLDDFGMGSGLLHRFRLTRVPTPSRPVEALRHNPQLAIAEPVAEHPLSFGVMRVVTNHATGLAHPDLSPVLRIRAIGEPDVTVAVSGSVGEKGATIQGRLLVVGDPSIVMNSMLKYPGNKQFAKNLISYVADDDAWGKRGGRIFIVAGAFDEHGAYGEAPNALSDWERTLKELAARTRKEGLPLWIAYAIAVLAGLGIVVWVGSRAGRPHRPVPPRYTRPIPLAAQGGVAGRASFIGGERTSRALAMLELKSAVEEDLAVLLGLDRVPAHDVLVKSVAAAGLLDTQALGSLRQLLLRMAEIETLMLSPRNDALRRIRDREVLVARAAAFDILGEAHAQAARRPGALTEEPALP
jgi:hypothetical protein